MGGSKSHVKIKEGFLIVDDSTLDKPYVKEMAFVRRIWSGKHHRTVKGIGLVSLVWTDGCTVISIDIRRVAVTAYSNNPLYTLN